MTALGRSAKLGLFESAAEKFFRGSSKLPERDAVIAAGPADEEEFVTLLPYLSASDIQEGLPLCGREGEEALDTLLTYRTKIQYTEGLGSWYTHDENMMYIDLTHKWHLLTTVVHEAAHARTAHEGLRPDIIKSDRKPYIEGMCKDESNAQVKQILSNMGYQRYAPNLPDVILQREYARGGEQAILDSIYSGRIVRCTDGIPYPQYYGRMWDVHHRG
ncbi:hypothetical protein [Actinoallomurus iriomotensis]|uniref:Uncharacterized protein n=1 Tax=Actinoallomurus iriomotensis TaxID=478107 RepID=A0A9W6RPX7_9ACTN|nr:hypothetical protein [Actinoallomurus iriomotensis]GLY77972.1 hypothetical protein Airi01_062390 [Actinoallomurus iriomotensis]